MQRSVFIDELRILAVCLVIVSHTIYALADRGVSGGILYYLTYTIGPFGVSLFIIISGYLAALGLNKDNAFTFYRKKFANLLPPIWVAFVFLGFGLFFLQVVANLSALTKFQFLITAQGEAFDIVSPLLYTALGIDGYIEASKLQINTYYTVGEWFTGFIILIFLITPLINLCLRARPSATLFILFIISAISFYFPQNGGFWNWIFVCEYNGFNPTTRIFEFGFGMYLYRTKNDFLAIKQWISLFIISCMLLAYIFLDRNLMNLGFSSYIFSCCFVVLFTERVSNNISGALKSIIIELAKLSFMAMIVHHQIVLFFVRNMPVDKMNTIGYLSLFAVEIFISFYVACILLPISKGISRILLSALGIDSQKRVNSL